ncbi:MAG TPA: carboxypeptidase-like regulatory domain-containing protein [Candidatus Sulfopaludibacter sp.]|nr:carboxypeptidase-like regulatory domain-containing protein [Candidatus Sulfopaludibacter sp.]
MNARMRRRNLLCAVGLCTACSWVPVLSAQSAEPAAPASLEGSVVNRATGAPVRHARIKYALESSAAVKDRFVSGADTDSSGHFAVQLTPGTYRLWVERPGFAKYVYGSRTSADEGAALSLAPGQQIRGLSIQMTPLGAISGRVADDEGDPLQGVAVQVLRASYAAGRRALLPVNGATSNDRGEYRAFGLPAGSYYLMATTIDAPTAGTYYPGGREPSSASEVALPEGGDVGGIDFRMARIRTYSVRGRLLSSAGYSGQLQAALAHDDGGFASLIGRQSVQVDRGAGTFEFRGVVPGSYWVIGSQFSGNQSLGGRARLDVSDTAPPGSVTISLMPGFAIGGKVEVEGGAAPEASVELIPSEGLALGPRPANRAGPEGSFRLPGVTPGIWELAVGSLPPGFCLKSATVNDVDLMRQELNLAADPKGELHIVLASNCAQVSGAVVDENGQPRSATVVLAPADPSLWHSRQMFAVAVTQAGGAFALGDVRAGTYKLFALEEVAPFEWLNPELMRRIESRAESISLAEGDRVTKRLAPIPPEALQPNP